MKCVVLLLMAIVIPATLGGQEVRIEGARHLPATTSPDGLWIVKPFYKDGRFVSYIWEEVKPPAPPAPPQPPAPPKPPPVPVPPVVPTPQCEVVYVCSTPVAPVPCWTYGPVGYYPAPRGCGYGFHPFRAIGRALFGRCR